MIFIDLRAINILNFVLLPLTNTLVGAPGSTAGKYVRKMTFHLMNKKLNQFNKKQFLGVSERFWKLLLLLFFGNYCKFLLLEMQEKRMWLHVQFYCTTFSHLLWCRGGALFVSPLFFLLYKLFSG